MRRVIALTMKFALGTGVLFCAICIAAPEAVVGLLTTDQVVAAEATRYLRVVGVTYLIFPLQASLVLCLRGVGVTKLGPVVSLVSLVLNVVGNWFLIYGNCGAPELAISMMHVLCFTVVCSCYEYPCMCGIIAGGGNTMFAFVMDVVFTLGVAIVGAALSAFVFDWPPLVTFALLKSDQVLKCIPNAIVVNRFRWARDLTQG